MGAVKVAQVVMHMFIMCEALISLLALYALPITFSKDHHVCDPAGSPPCLNTTQSGHVTASIPGTSEQHRRWHLINRGKTGSNFMGEVMCIISCLMNICYYYILVASSQTRTAFFNIIKVDFNKSVLFK